MQNGSPIGSMNHRRLGQLGSALWLAATFTAAAVGHGQRLVIATVEFTHDWNPITQQSYPSQLVARFTTEQLFEKRCLGGPEQNKPWFESVCQLGTGYDPGGSIRLILDDDHCPGLSAADVAFTVDQIGSQPRNEYYLYDLSVSVSKERLSVGKPRAPAEWVAKEAFSFPILRRPPGHGSDFFFKDKVTVGNEQIYNKATGGLFEIRKISDTGVILGPRSERKFPQGGNLREIELVFFDRFLNLQEKLSGLDPPDLILSWPTTKIPGSSSYRFRRTEKLASFTYIGFNFGNPNREHRRLIRSRLFRELFTKSLWALTPIGERVDFFGRGGEIKGIYLGESLDTGLVNSVDRPTRAELKQAIRVFLGDQGWSHVERFVILVSPSFEQIFNRQDRANIQEELNGLWRADQAPGIRFELLDPSAGQAAFEAEKPKGEYQMIFGTFVYGCNHLRYMAFLQPGHELNYLQVDIPALSKDRIEEWMKQGTQGIKEFLDVVAEEYPIAVIGYFPRRDLFHESVEIPEDCRPGAVALPYQSFDRWQKKPGIKDQ